ncbi:hypothetical protein G7070_00645 [Propioniciclava coleopterorum]|uniref:Phosphohistidine phosphatase n=1 Tax=Propioniciclava coleopterorum TaxID=2714937 RepID=A0A6G7Y2M4_9ACTN|nr:histidine phosphatase family protein [Propioniciclava coleopterorum]QIK71062.1 hypothetical protein G7070_00645 [Propioniciclava coleopterorum]
MKSVFLIRHGEAEFTGRGRGDHGRILTDEGLAQAARLGELLADAGVEVVLASSADRALQTARGMALPARVEPLDELYNASTLGILRALADLDEGVTVAALVAHAPGVPALVDELTGPGSDPDAIALVRSHYPTATVARIDFDGGWDELAAPRLAWADRG